MIIDLIDKTKSNIEYLISIFPDGEPHIKFLNEINRKEEYTVKCRIASPNDLFIVLQVGNILSRQGVIWSLHITYLMSARMDRVISFNEAFSLEIVANMINSMNPFKVYINEVHSDRALKLINNSSSIYMSMPKNTTLCFPDKGAFNRYCNKPENPHAILMDKKRNLDTGRIESLVLSYIPQFLPYDSITIIDDLCDAGGTFVLASKLLKERFPDKEINIQVAHLVNPIGLENLSKNFSKVSISNTYLDWDISKFSNVTINSI